MNLNYFIYINLFFFSLIMFLNFYKQILMTLLSLEFVMLSFMVIFFYYMVNMLMLILILYYLIFVVCESVLGLTLLISLVRNYGNDNMLVLNLMLW